MKQIITGVAVVVIVGCVTSLRSFAADEGQGVPVQQGKLSYDRYCTPCHGAGGAPGSAVFAATKKPIDLRTYEQRNGGRFPSWKWWDVTFNPQTGGPHTKVWEKIRNDQSETEDAKTEVSREIERNIAARGVVAYIEYYVMSIQNKNR